MIYAEYKEVQNYSYFEYCDYLNNKYAKRSNSGLFKHHYYEYRKANLSHPNIICTEEEKDTIIYCNFLEHLFLHILIGEQTDSRLALGLGGAINYIIPQINKFLDFGLMDYSPKYYENIDKDVFQLLCERCNKCISETKIALEHNNQLYLEVEQTLNNRGKALVVLGTGLGKTTTALQYLWNNKCRALVIGPNKLIKSGWEEYPDWVDTTTYQSFANKYLSINYSKYGLVIIDEAHHAGFDENKGKGAEVWNKGIQYLIDNSVVKVLGLTATPNRSDNIDIGSTLFDGCVCEGYAVEDGIEKGLIYPFDYITALYNTEELVEEYRDCDNRELVGQLDLALQQSLTLKDIFYKYMSTDVKRKGIIFIQDIKDEQYVKDIMSDCYPSIEYRAIHSKMNKDEVNRNRKWFESTEEGYLLAVNMISEGAHYRGVNTLIMFRKTSSYLVYTQQLGRIITLTKNENPNAIVFDLVNNIDSIEYNNRDNEDKRYQVSRIVRALEKSPLQKSRQVIIADESRDIVKAIREIKQFENDSWEDWEIEILQKYYVTEGPENCQKRIDEEWERRYPGSLTKEQVKEFIRHHRSYAAVKAAAKFYKCAADTHLDWTAEELTWLELNHTKSRAEILQVLGARHSWTAIRGTAKRLLGLDVRAAASAMTDEEKKLIITNYEAEGPDTCVQLLNGKFKRSTIINIAGGMGLHYKPNKMSSEELDFIRTYYSIEGREGLYKRLQGKYSKVTIMRAAKELGVTYGKKITEDTKFFIKQNYTTMTSTEMAEALNMSTGTISSIMKQLNLVSPHSNKNKAKQVKCVETGRIWNTVKAAVQETGVTSISYALRNNVPAGGYHWEYVEEDTE